MTPGAIFLSVRPQYAEKILRGEKSVELRRVRPRLSPGDVVVMYVSSPQREIKAFLLVEEVLEASPTDLWDLVGSRAGVTKSEYQDYFEGIDYGVGIVVSVAQNLKKPLSLDELRMVAPDFRPPQSFRYVDGLAAEIRVLLWSMWEGPACKLEVN